MAGNHGIKLRDSPDASQSFRVVVRALWHTNLTQICATAIGFKRKCYSSNQQRGQGANVARDTELTD